jgi:hypothetical protein
LHLILHPKDSIAYQENPDFWGKHGKKQIYPHRFFNLPNARIFTASALHLMELALERGS